MQEPVSVVIRAWNEAKELERLLHALASQDYEGAIELIVVDNGSTDDTAEVAKRAKAKVVTLSQEEFNYPKSLNLGIGAARNEVVVEVVAHVVPLRRSWLSSGVRHFVDPHVAGVYAPIVPFPESSLAEKVLNLPAYWLALWRGARPARRVDTGIMGATNIIIRKSVWEKHPFDERYAAGGEDEAWARWALKHGYTLICDPDFAVYHSHRLGTVNVIKQLRHWRKAKRPLPFDKKQLVAFRPDLER